MNCKQYQMLGCDERYFVFSVQCKSNTVSGYSFLNTSYLFQWFEMLVKFQTWVYRLRITASFKKTIPDKPVENDSRRLNRDHVYYHEQLTGKCFVYLLLPDLFCCRFCFAASCILSPYPFPSFKWKCIFLP